ncbi:MAG: protein translocase subunit SecD, partial [Nitrospirales bacterium]
MKKLRGRFLLLGVVTVVSCILAIPSFPGFYQSLPEGIKYILSPRGLSLGLDLQGGIHLVLEVEEERAVEIAVDRSRKAVEELLAEKTIVFDRVEREGQTVMVIDLQNESDGEEVRMLIEDAFPSFEPMKTSGTRLEYELRSTEAKRIKTSAIDQALETLRNRIDQFGVAEPLIQRLGLNQIAIQLPGVKDPQRAKDLIQKTALLEFKMLDESKMALDLPLQVQKGQEEKIIQDFAEKVPEGSEILFETVKAEPEGTRYSRPYLVKKDAALVGDLLQDASVTIGDFNEPAVSVTFDSKGAREFDLLTAANVGKRMAIVLDGKVYSAPTINERISGGRAVISGTFTTAEAN